MAWGYPKFEITATVDGEEVGSVRTGITNAMCYIHDWMARYSTETLTIVIVPGGERR